MKGLVVSDKRTRVKNFHQLTLLTVAEILGAMGLHSHRELTPQHLRRRVSAYEVKSWGELVEWAPEGAWVTVPPLHWAKHWDQIKPTSFGLS